MNGGILSVKSESCGLGIVQWGSETNEILKKYLFQWKTHLKKGE